VTVLLAVLMTETALELWLVTYAVVPFGVIATPMGILPTVIVLMTVLVAVLMTETVPADVQAGLVPH